MKKSKSLLALLLAVACILSLLAGCGGSTVAESSTELSKPESDSSSVEESSEPAGESSEAGETVEEAEHEPITLMDAQRDYSAFIELVHKYYPEINIEIVPYRGRNMSAYCKQQLETGCMPDIYSTTQAWSGDIQAEHLIDLSQYDVSKLYTVARVDEYLVDGALYLLPFDYSVSGILCNESLLERNDIEVPTSFRQLREETIPALQEKGIKTSVTLMDLPGSGFNYFFNVGSTIYMNTKSGREWRSAFTDIDSDTLASDNERVQECVDLMQQWIDCGMITWEEGISGDYSAALGDFLNGNAAFLVGTVHRFTQNEDGTGDRYRLLPYLSENGDQNSYITSPSRFYGLNKELAEPGNEQKLEDALHVLEILSTNEGYLAINGESSTNMCSIAEFEVSEDSPYAEAVEGISKGFSMAIVYTGWDSYVAGFGNEVISWIKGETDGKTALESLDSMKLDQRENGVTVYATVTEELDTVQAAQLCGQMFMEATEADAALISYNVYSPEVNALMENSYGANGHILVGDMTEEYIVIFLPTGWSETLLTLDITGAEIKAMAESGADTRNTGYKYPYVFLTADGQPLEDDETYTVVVCGYNKSEKETLGLTDTGIVGLDAAKDYLLKVGEISSATLDESLVQSVGFEEK